jgi:predicted metal-dependent enzyme (double-stranded beta helix superfamily)
MGKFTAGQQGSEDTEICYQDHGTGQRAMLIHGCPLAGAGSRRRLSRAELSLLAAGTAARADRWRDLVRYDPARRWYHRMELTSEYEVWLLSWQPGQGTGFHDHGGSAGAFAVALGQLQEQTVRASRQVAARTISTGAVRSFGVRFVHHVGNTSAAPAVSVHAYSPPLAQMRRFELTLHGLRYVSTEPAQGDAYPR